MHFFLNCSILNCVKYKYEAIYTQINPKASCVMLLEFQYTSLKALVNRNVLYCDMILLNILSTVKHHSTIGLRVVLHFV